MMTLYSGITDPFSHRCRIVLYEKGMDFEIIDVDLMNKPEDLAVMNPYNRTPVLVERASPDPPASAGGAVVRVHHRQVLGLVHEIDVDDLEVHALLVEHDAAPVAEGIGDPRIKRHHFWFTP